MKVLVLGGNGYLGNVLCPKLYDAGHEVTSIDLNWFGDYLPKTINSIVGDIRDEKLMKKEIINADAVIHLAAVVGPGMCDVMPKTAQEVNYDAFKNIVPLVKEHKKKYLYTSTCSVYGFDEERFLGEDSTGIFPVSHYGIVKAKAEKIITDQLPDATVFRLGTLYGYSPRMRYDLVTNIFIAQGLNKKTITVHGGEQWRPMVCVEDVANAFVWSLDRDVSGLYNVIYNNYTIKLLAEILSAKFDVPYTVDPTKSDVRSTFAKGNKLRVKGFTPKYGPLHVIDKIRESGTWKDFDKILSYSNIKIANSIRYRYEKGEVVVQ